MGEERYKSNYEYFKSMGICPTCRKEKSAPGHVACFDCLDKKRIYNEKYRNDPVKKDEARKRNIENYYKRKSLGICVNCKKKATHGLYCYEHYIYRVRRTKEISEKRKLERAEKRAKENGEDVKRRTGTA